MGRMSAGPSYRDALRIPRFRRFFVSRAVSLLGDAVVPTAVTLSLIQRDSSGRWLGAMLAAALLPKILLLAVGGVAGDRLAKLPLMMASAAVCGGMQLATALVLVADGSLWWALAFQIGYGISIAIGYPAAFGYLPHCVEPARLASANGLLSATTAATSLVGPAVTAGIASVADPALALGVDGATFLVSAILLAGLPRGGPTGRVSRGVAALREGWHALRALPWLLRMTIVDGLMLLVVVAPFMVLAPAFVEHLGPSSWALLMLAFAAGELFGSLAGGRVQLLHPLLIASLGLLAVGVPPLLIALRAGTAPLLVAQLLAGIGIGAYTVVVNTATQRSASPEYLARVNALVSIGSFALLPLGYVLAPAVATVTGSNALLWIAAGWPVLSVFALLVGRDLRRFSYSPIEDMVPATRNGEPQ
jgi:MFS family permease